MARLIALILIGVLMATHASAKDIAKALANPEELIGSQRLLHGPNFEMLNAPSDNAKGRLSVLPPGLPPPYLDGSFYKNPYPEQQPPPKKKLQPHSDEPSG